MHKHREGKKRMRMEWNLTAPVDIHGLCCHASSHSPRGLGKGQNEIQWFWVIVLYSCSWNFTLAACAVIGFFKVTWHLTIKQFPPQKNWIFKLGIILTQLGLTTLVKRARISNPSLKALLQRLVAYPATGKLHLLQMYYAVTAKKCAKKAWCVHVQSCCFADLNLLLSWRSRCAVDDGNHNSARVSLKVEKRLKFHF